MTIRPSSLFSLRLVGLSRFGSTKRFSILPEDSTISRSISRPRSSPSFVIIFFPASCFAMTIFTMSSPSSLLLTLLTSSNLKSYCWGRRGAPFYNFEPRFPPRGAADARPRLWKGCILMKDKTSHLGKIVRNGKVLILAMDQGMEHGPRDFNAKNISPEYVCDIASRGGFTGFAIQKGVARQYKENYSGKVPLILKLNGRTEIVPKDEAYSPQICSVKQAVALGADAVGYTIYVGSPREP